MKIAIIGTGISGLGAAYLLHPRHDITVYEEQTRPGGYSRTIEVPGPQGPLPVDTGFIVFNDRNYPLLRGLFEHLGVPVEKSDMSFGVSIAGGWLEYGSKNMFAQPVNLLRPRFWRMLADILRFNRQAVRYMDDDSITLGECLDRLRMGDWFRRYYLLAMGAAIWSCPVETILDFPASTFIRFFKNHGLLTVNGHPQWYTVTGGSREYIKILTAGFRDRIRTGCGVRSVAGESGKVVVHDTSGNNAAYDHVVFACHADQALRLLASPTTDQQAVLGAFQYQENSVVTHGDVGFMPKRRGCWVSWIYLSEETRDKKPVLSLSYWMNNLQNLDPAFPVIVTLNPGRRPDEKLLYDEHVFRHPVFNLAAIRAQGAIAKIQGAQNLWFCGAWQRYGFHEDGLMSAVAVARKLGAEILEITPHILMARVMHGRLFPKVNRFTYGIYYLAFPLAQMNQLADGWRFGVNRRGLLGFYERDHGARDGSALEPWIRKILSDHGIRQADGDVVLLAMPRVLGYVFNPISFWLCLDKEGLLRAVLCEVCNTFGENHSYLCAHADRRAIAVTDVMETEKLFHVSPFLQREGSYRFRFDWRPGKFGAWIDYYDGAGKKQLVTTLAGDLMPYSRTVRRHAFWRYPLVTVRAISLIHWQAARLFLKRMRYVPKPPQKTKN